jgi:hypothetical protein
MEEVGDYTAEGFAVGIEKNRSVQPAWASMLNVPQRRIDGRQEGSSRAGRAGRRAADRPQRQSRRPGVRPDLGGRRP